MKNIVVVGSLNVDLVAYISRMPAEGETLTGNDFATFPGGKGANQAVAAARLGARVSMVGRLGNDVFASQLRQALGDADVDNSCVSTVSGPTGSAVILVTQHGGNSIVVIPGANAALGPEDLSDHMDLFSNAAVILAQLEIPMETVVRLGEIAAQFGVPFILDPAPSRDLPEELLRNVTWLTPNETEAQIILDGLGYPPGDPENGREALDAAADRLLATGVRNVILKLGSSGIYLKGADAKNELMPTFQVHAVDTTAAGDAFNGGFAYALTHGKPPAEAARFACAVAAISVTRVGAQPSMPGIGEVNELMNRAAQEADADRFAGSSQHQ
jgi:ribokinase